MRSVFFHDVIIGVADGEAAKAGKPSGEGTAVRAAAPAEDIRFTYCTEFLINRDNGCVESPVKLRAYLESVGDCVVVVDDDSIIKVHVHTNEPGNVIQKALGFGALVSIKIENMREQHENASWGAVSADEGERKDAEAVSDTETPRKRYGMVAVASGEGIEEMFREIGVDKIVTGGQTMNPSTEDILKAVQGVSASMCSFSNNKNIIMAPSRVAPLPTKASRAAHKEIPQGIPGR